jgi:hypothetical protein
MKVLFGLEMYKLIEANVQFAVLFIELVERDDVLSESFELF